jgi:hypothetical protein
MFAEAPPGPDDVISWHVEKMNISGYENKDTNVVSSLSVKGGHACLVLILKNGIQPIRVILPMQSELHLEVEVDKGNVKVSTI